MKSTRYNVRKSKTSQKKKRCGCLKSKTKTKLTKRGGRYPFYLLKKKSKRSKRRTRSKRQRGGYTTPSTQATTPETACDNNSPSAHNELEFKASFSKTGSANNNNTAPPTCNYIGQNVDGTKAYSCVN